MPTARDILAAKEAAVHEIAASATVLEATLEMNRHKIGAVVVSDGERIVGIFTERDVLRRVVAELRSPGEVKVAEVMTRKVICCEEDTDLDDISAIMKERRIRHVPVCDGQGKIVGLISIGDINAHYASKQDQTIHFLNDYIYGRA